MGYDLVLGLGNNVDYEICWDGAVLEALARAYGIRQDELLSEVSIVDERSLVASILGFLASGRGGERFAASPAVIERFAARFEKKITLGGTPIRAAIALKELGVNCALHMVTMNEHVRRLTPQGCAYVCSCAKERVYPHLIVQFRRGDRVKTDLLDVTAPSDNRIIYDNDPQNIEMALNEEFARFFPQARALLISGFNAMQDAVLMQKRVLTLRRMMTALPDDAVVYYEDGGFHDQRLRAVLRRELEALIDIHGMNEDELQGYLGRDLDLMNAAEVAQALEDAARLIQAPTILVHTRCWALAFGKNAPALSQALSGGIALAGTRYRFGDGFTPKQYWETRGLDPMPEGAAFARQMRRLMGGQLCCLPSLNIEEREVTTIGLGDAFVGGFLAALCQPALSGRPQSATASFAAWDRENPAVHRR